MLAATVKIGAKNFVHVDVLQAIKSKMDHLPVKQKTMLDFRDAAMFLYPCIKTALQKNYTKDEILQIIVKEGWALTHNSFRYLWSFFLSENEHSAKKKSVSKSTSREKHVNPKTDAKTNTDKSQENQDVNLLTESGNINRQAENLELPNLDNTDIKHDDTENQSPADEKAQPEKSEPASTQPVSARFDLPPDTEDL